METSTHTARSPILEAGWHARMSSRLADKGACACVCAGFQHPASAVAPSGHRRGVEVIDRILRQRSSESDGNYARSSNAPKPSTDAAQDRLA